MFPFSSVPEGAIHVPRNSQPLVAGTLSHDVVILAIAIPVLDDGIGAEVVCIVFQIDVLFKIRRFVSSVGKPLTEGVNRRELVLDSGLVLIVTGVGFWAPKAALIATMGT